ncbi:MAG: NADH-quinone oxidoreductase subunit J [Planctomycetes bacterium]|nr:NADH-quinone oxidoreductase subunit J [Planctomycetota bacterium]
MDFLDVLFLGCAALAVVLAVLTVSVRNAVTAAFTLVAMFFPVAAIFLALSATFLAVIQVLVYAGAIMVLFTFVIMMINPRREEAVEPKEPDFRLAAAVFAALFFLATTHAVTTYALSDDYETAAPAPAGEAGASGGAKAAAPAPAPAAKVDGKWGGPKEIGEALFNRDQGFTFQFEAVSVLILVAAVGAVVLAKRRL